jgi:hypothetical protein
LKYAVDAAVMVLHPCAERLTFPEVAPMVATAEMVAT